MNVTVNRAEFLAAAKRAASVAPLSSPLEPLRGILLETDRREGCLTISATNLEVSLVQTIPCTSLDADALVLNARLLEGMLDKLEGDSVTLIRVEQQPVVLLTSGLAAYRIGVWERGIFPQIESPYPADTVLVTGIPAMTKRTIFAVGEKKNTPLLRCVNLMFTPNGLKAVGSNGSCVVSAKGDSQSTGNISLLVPASSLGKLAHMCEDTDEFRVGTTGDHIVFFRDGLLFSARLMSGRYINTEQLISSLVNTFTVFTDVTDLRDGLYTACSVEADGKVMLHFEGDRLIFLCDGVYGSAVSQIDVIPLKGTPQGEFWYLTRPLLTCLDALSGTVQLGAAQGGLLTISTEDAFYMQNGVRPPSEQQSSKAA